MPHPRSGLLLALVLCAAALIRLAYLYELRETLFFDQLVLDLASYDGWARRIADGAWLGTGVFYQDPLYPYFLGSLYFLLGPEFLPVYLIQIGLGVLTCYLVYWLGARMFSWQAGLVAAGLAAIYKPFVFHDVQIEKSFLAVLLIAGSCALVVRATEARTAAWWGAAGFVLALSALVRGNYLALIPFVAVCVVLVERGPRRWKAAMSFAAGAALLLAFPLARNGLVGGDWVLTTSQAGQNFYIGNNPENLTGMYRAPEFVRADPAFEAADFHREAERIAGRDLKPSEVSAFWLRRSREFIEANPLAFLKLLGLKAALFWNAHEIPDNLDMYFFERFSRVMRAWLPGFGLVAPLGLLGMIWSIREWRRLWPLYVFPAAYFLSVVAFYVFARYRLPIVPFVTVFAGHALLQLYRFARERQWRPLLTSAAILVGAAVLVHLPMVGAYNPAAIDNLGAVLLRAGDLDGAEDLFRQVLDRRPEFSDARNNLGIVLLRRGDAEGAMAELREAIRLRPRSANSYVNLGHAHLALARRDGGDHLGRAEESFRTALELDPESPEGWAGLGLCLRAEGDTAGSLEALGKALELAPDSAENHNNLAIALLGAGRPEESLQHFEEAVRLRSGFAEAYFNMGICLERLRRLGPAATAYRKAASLKSGYAEAYNNLGNILAEMGDREGAIEAYEQFLRSWRGDPAVREAVQEEIRRLNQGSGRIRLGRDRSERA